ncbi:MAG: shikimate dehydrogenase [Coriobacteriia bacterium]|nr:shikimate dehydrogenase [Coriobacteriia bacterium]MCL2536692.1 shikimate dehydrogenase [Coriobacteriia bacterium]
MTDYTTHKVQKYLVVGTPITQSLSPLLHNAVYQQLKLPRELEALDPGDEAGFEVIVHALRSGAFAGACVTIPYKLAAFEACDRTTTAARRTGAVNYIRREADGSLFGDNTDAGGFARALTRELEFDMLECTAVVCGSGGASRAIVDALLQGGADQIALVTRDPRRVVQDWQLEDTSIGDKDRILPLSYQGLEMLESPVDLLVNATPLGMADNRMPVSEVFLGNYVAAVYDAVYRKDGTTALVGAAHYLNIPAADGRSMLVEQAILGMRFWGVDADSRELRSIIDASLTQVTAASFE